MLLAARCAWICSEAYMIKTTESKDGSRIKWFDIVLEQIKEEISDSWDRGRYFDDPQKTKEMYQNDRDQYVNILINKLCIE